MAKFKDLQSTFDDAKYRVRMADKNLNAVLDQMVKGGLAKIVPDQDDSWEVYIVGSKKLLDDICYVYFEGEDVQFWGVDQDGREEAKEQGCDPNEFCEELFFTPNEKVEWFLKKYVG